MGQHKRPRSQRCSATLLALALAAGCAIAPALGARLPGAGSAATMVASVMEDPPTPIWHPRFTVDFNETVKILATMHMRGRWYYDAAFDREAVYRDNGQGDRFCGSIHPLSATPCTHLVVGDKRYLIFPDLGECCMCCTAAQGCGMLSPKWLEFAEYQGIVPSPAQGVPAYKWRKDGLQKNYWYATADARQVPLQLDQMPNDRQTYQPATFTTAPIDDDIFAVPDNCRAKCPTFSTCTIAAMMPPAF